MLSKNNYQERLRKMERKQERFSIRKFSVGAASVLIGVLFFMNEGPTNHVVHASEVPGHNVTVKSDTGNASAKNEVTQPKTETPAQTTGNQVAQKQEASPASVAPTKAVTEAVNSDAAKSDAAKEVKSPAPASEAKATDKKNANTLTVNTKDLANANGSLNALADKNALNASKAAVKSVATDEHTADVDNFADLSRAIANKDINTINLTKDIDLTNMTEEQSQVDGGLVSGGTGLTGDNWLQPYELAANKNSNSPYTGIARDLTVNGNDHTINTGKWFISLWNQNQDGNDGWHLTFNDMTVKNNATSTRYTPIYFGNMNDANKKKVSLTFNNFTADLNTPLTNDEDGVDVIFKGKDVINVSPLANNFSGSIEQGADRNIIYARNVLIDDNADVSITASMTGSFGIGGATAGVQDEEHNIIKLSPDTSDKNDPAGNMAVGKNAKLTINTNGIDGKGSTTSLRGIVSRNTNGTLTLNEGATVNMTLGKGHSSAVLLSNLDLKKGSTLNIDTMQDNGGFSQRMSGNMGSDGWIYAPIALGAISFSQTGNARLTVADGATLKMKRGNVKTSTAMIQLGGSTVFGGQAYDLEFADGSTIDIQDASDNEGMTLGVGNIGIATGKKEAYSPLINIMKTSKVGTIGQVKYLNLQRTNPNGYSVGNLIAAESGLHMDAGKFGGVDIKQWDKGNNNTEPNKTWQVQNFSEESSGKINAAGMAPVDNNKLNDFLSSVNFVKGTQQRLVMTSMDLEAYNYDARYKDSTAKVGETINIDSPTFYQVGEDGTLTPANPNPDLLDNTATGHPYQLGWAQTGNVAVPQGASIDFATGKITFAANEGQVGTVVNIPVTVTYKDDSIDQVIAPVYVLGNDTTPVWQKDDNGNTTGAVAIQYAAGNLPETTDKSAQVENIADNYKLTYYAVPTKDNPEVTPVDITSYGKVSWAKAPTTVVDTPSDKTTVTAPVSISFAPDSTVVKNGYVKGGTQTVDLNLDLTGATAKDTNLGFSKKSIDNGLTQTQFKRLVDTTALDNAGIDYTLSWAQTPTTKAQNTGVVRVTYPSVMQADGSTPAYLDIPVQYKVNDPVQTADDVDVTYPTTAVEANKPATIAPVITDNDGKTVDVPEGTKFAIDGNAPAGATIDPATGVVTIPATNTTGVTTVPVTVTYPDGSTTQTTVKSVSVATNDDVKNPTSPYDMIKDPANLPAGTKVTWADDNTPAAGDNVPAKVIVTVPGAEPIEVTGTAHYDDNAIYTPQVKNPVQATPESLPDAAAQIMNMDKLPEGTTAAWQDGQQVPVTAGQTIPGTIVVTYPDGSTDKVSTTLTTTGLTDADQYTPEPAADLTTEVGKVPEAAKAIANADQMPEGTTYTWTKEPDVSKVGDTTGEVTVTYPDGTTDTVTVPVTVTGEKVDKTALQKAVDEAPTVEKTPAYENGTPEAKKAYDDAVDAGQKVLDDPAATQDQVDKATKAIEDAKKGLDGKINVTPYEPAASSSASEASSAADVAKSNASSAASNASSAASAASVASSAADKNPAAKSDADKASSAASVASSAADKASSAASVASTAASDAQDQKSIASEQDSIASSAASAGNSSAASEAQSKASEAAKKASEDADIAKSAASEASSAQSTASSAASTASSAASAAESEAGIIPVTPYEPSASSSASEASSAASQAKSNADKASSANSDAQSNAAKASSAAEKNSAAKSDADKASSAASVASSAAAKASSAASTASSAASDAKDQKSIASEQDSIASSAASAGNSSAASEAQSKASEAAKKASEDADIAKSAASTASDAQSAASSAASTASSAASAAESEAGVIDVTPYEPKASSSASVASSAADVAKSNASSAASNASNASSAASAASSAAEKNSAAKSDADKASSAASVASSAAQKASSAASTASSAASDAKDQKSIASEQDSIASSAASAGNSSAASEAQSKASEAAKKASEDADIAKSAASESSSAASTASSASSTASSAASEATSIANSSASSDYASQASSAASEAGSHASDASSSSSNASSAASEAKSNADKDPNNSKASSAASKASSAASTASSAASEASSAASDASSAASKASSAQSAASSYASEGNSSAASSAESEAKSAASQAKKDDSVASSAASKASSAASTASSAASEASSAASSASSSATPGSSSASSDYSSAASSAASEAGSHASDASSSSSNASSAASEAKSNADKDPNNSKASSAASTASSAASEASSAASTASSAASDASSAASKASSAQSAASSYASEGNSSAASSAESVASSAASQAKSDDSVASSAASKASSAASTASSAASEASSAASSASSSATPGSSSASSDYASQASSAASDAKSHASDASSSASTASSAASQAKSNADKNPTDSAAKSDADKASSAASKASSAASTASSAASDASSAASSAESVASSAASQAKKDDSVASSAASEASSAASTASEASSAVNDDLNPSSAASSAATNAGKYASEASSSASVASSAASVASSAAATDPTNSQVASDAVVASSASSVASSAASTASNAASAASSAASEANKAQQEADSYAKEGNSSAATSAHAKAQSYASDAKSDESVASSAASVASSAAEVAKKAADDAEKTAQADQHQDDQNTGDNTNNNPQQPTDNNNGKSDNNNSGKDTKDNGNKKDNGKSNQGNKDTNKGTNAENHTGKGDNNKGTGANQSAPVITNNPTNFAGNNAGDSLLDTVRPLSQEAEALAEEGYVVTVGPHGQIIDSYPAADGQGMIIYVDANGNVIGKVKVARSGKLPQTGAKDNKAGIFGLALASIAGFFGLAAGKKRKKND
ncbi:Rib/alpha-like domain-containing protein [Lactobacillus sp. PV034]|uniref:Rib/alpha-like domain-containing protein n=1 Tax=Lactobacillus sp. PV034 TaxID=2594495 RepID=UPI00223EF2CD|nr:Rib/alpha-like domain-containing protein [Lactobacillus sp. PV034]QNQ81173.1 LPXTG cell wall anchor domain-containing protein [Lactobacillus sp. PV034]